MKKRFLIPLTLCLGLSLCNLVMVQDNPYAGGTGTESDPYQISTPEQLISLSDAVNDGSAEGYPGEYFVLTDDIDLAGVSWQGIGCMDLEDMSNTDCMFFGTFDGNTISGTDENGGLFSHEYKFVSPLSLAGMMDGYLYETEDEDAGEFRYFFMMSDTPATT